MKLRKSYEGWIHKCPGCEETHYIPTDAPLPNNAKWEFNGSQESPTFTPSVRITWEWGEEHEHNCCHYNITNGQIIFHDDSTHSLKGQTVALPDID